MQDQLKDRVVRVLDATQGSVMRPQLIISSEHDPRASHVKILAQYFWGFCLAAAHAD